MLSPKMMRLAGSLIVVYSSEKRCKFEDKNQTIAEKNDLLF